MPRDEAVQHGLRGRRCLRLPRSTWLRLDAVSSWPCPPDSLADSADEEDLEAATDPFLDVPWWTLGRAISEAKLESPSPSGGGMSSGDGEVNDDLATILRLALMDLAAALQEIERQLTSIPEDGASPTRG